MPAHWKTLIVNVLVAGLSIAATNSSSAQEAASTQEPLKTLKATRHANHQAWQAIDQASTRVVGWQRLPDVPSYREFLDDSLEFESSRSVGSVSQGRLDNAHRLPEVGRHHSIIERHRSRDTAWSTEPMLNAILFSARHVNENAQGAPLRVGNMSRRDGGNIRWSRSHNSGRDADLAFYVTDLDGNSVPAPDLLQFDDEGIPFEREDLRFDTARNWLLVRGLLNNPYAQIQYLFISEALKTRLLEFAQASQEPESLIARARDVLHQPTDALPHDDHFHLRIGCPRMDRLAGCVESGPRWEWGNYHHPELIAQVLKFRKALDDPNPETRLAALDYLSEMRSPFASEFALTWAIRDDDPTVRSHAIQVASRAWPWSATTVVMAQNLIEEEASTLEDRAWGYSILRRSRDELAFEFVKSRLASDAVEPRERVYAARALGHFMVPELVPFLIEQLAEHPAAVREELATVLRRITNHSLDYDWVTLASTHADIASERWAAWYEEHREEQRDKWLSRGFAQSGVEISEYDAETMDALIDLLPRAPDHVVYNINLTLRELTGRWSPLESTDGHALYVRWADWWQKNRARYAAQPSS